MLVLQITGTPLKRQGITMNFTVPLSIAIILKFNLFDTNFKSTQEYATSEKFLVFLLKTSLH